MKISTVRSLLVLLDLALVGGIVGVVYLDMAVQQDERRAARRSYQQETLRRLAAVSVVAPKASTDQTYDAIGALNFAGTPPTVEGPKVPEQPKIPTKEWRPLGDLLTLAGAERHGSGVESPSFILYRRTGDKPIERKPITPASRPGGRSNDPRGAARNRGRPNATRPRTVPKPSGPQRRTYSAWLGDAIELSDHEIAIVKDIRTVRDELLGQVVGWKVVFDYNGKEVELEVVGDTPRSGKSKAPVADKPVNPDPGTWLGWSSETPHEIRVTEEGVRAFKQKGEKVLDGVRWGNVKVPGRKNPAVQVTHVPQGSAMERAGVRPGDAFASINGTAVTSRADIVRYVRQHPNSPKYTVVFYRDGARRTRTVIPPRN